MAKAGKKDVKGGISGMLKEGLDGSRRSLSRIEAEGERLLKGVVDLTEKYVPEAQRKAIEDLTQEARKLFNQMNESIEENTKKVVDRLNLPTKKDLEDYNKKVRVLIEENVTNRLEKLKVPTGKEFDAMGKQLKGNLDDQVKKGLSRLNIATKKDVDSVTKDVKKLRKDVNAMLKPAAPKKKAVKKVVKKAAKKAKKG